MTTPRQLVDDDALVLSGGGALGAFEAGVIKALADGASPSTGYQPLTAEITTGTSVGAYNAAFLCTQGVDTLAEAADLLIDIWRNRIANGPTRCGNGVYRIRDAPFTLDPACLRQPLKLFADGVLDAAYWSRYWAVRGVEFATSTEPLDQRVLETVNFASLFDESPLLQLIVDTINPAALRGSSIRLTVAATNWREGTLTLFSAQDIADRVGPSAIAASAAIPGIFPPVEIDGVPFVDGGVVLNTPIEPAIQLGADILHVIYLDPDLADIEISNVPNTAETIYRLFAIFMANQTNRDIATAELIQLELEILRDQGVLRDDFMGLASIRDMPAGNSPVLERFRLGRRPYRPLVIHRYRPLDPLGTYGAAFDYRGRFIDELIQTGYDNAVNHDCDKENCICPIGS